MGEHFAPISKERYAELLEAESKLAAAEQARDQAQASLSGWGTTHARLCTDLAAAEARATRLAALEAAARACLNPENAWYLDWNTLRHAVAALDAVPATEGAPDG